MPRAVGVEVERHRKAALLDAYLAELDGELGPAAPEQIAEADSWAARLAGSEAGQGNESRSA
jgi:hypothetical protein